MIPEIERLFLPFLDTAWDMKLERGVTHSLGFMLVVSALLAKWLVPQWKREKVTRWRRFGAIMSVLVAHGLVDACSLDGVWLGWPFGGHVSFALLPQVDFVLPVIFAFAVVLGWRVPSTTWKKGKGGRKAVGAGLFIGLTYIGIAYGVKSSMRGEMVDDMQRRGISWERVWTVPEGGTILLWRGLLERQGEIWVGYRSILDGDVPVAWTIYPTGNDVPEELDGAFEVQAMKQRSGGWYLSRPTRRGLWLVDLRVMAQREWDDRGVALRPIRAWEYQVNGRGDVLKKTLRRPFRRNYRRMISRMFGDDEDWADRPRLIGNPSEPQEYLSVLR